jgi:hypothetical protein
MSCKHTNINSVHNGNETYFALENINKKYVKYQDVAWNSVLKFEELKIKS